MNNADWSGFLHAYEYADICCSTLLPLRFLHWQRTQHKCGEARGSRSAWGAESVLPSSHWWWSAWVQDFPRMPSAVALDVCGVMNPCDAAVKNVNLPQSSFSITECLSVRRVNRQPDYSVLQSVGVRNASVQSGCLLGEKISLWCLLHIKRSFASDLTHSFKHWSKR